MITLIAAFSEGRVIGIENKLPWSLPNDLNEFKKKTVGKTIVMGRKTYDSIGRPLPDRNNVVLTNDREWNQPGVNVIHSIEELRTLDGEIMIIGGSAIYEQTIGIADRLYITFIKEEIVGDAYFPEIDPSVWKMVDREKGLKNEKNPYDYFFEVYEKRRGE